MLWTDERIAFEIGNLTKGRPAGEVAHLLETVRDEYEARIAELEKERDEYKDVAAANAAINRQCKERIKVDAVTITDLKNQLGKAQNEIVMESGERAAYQVSCAELERIIEDMQNSVARYDARITMMEQKERQDKEHMSRLHTRIAELEAELAAVWERNQAKAFKKFLEEQGSI